MNQPFTVEIPIEQFDLSLLPEPARTVGSQPFRDAVVAFFHAELRESTDWIQIGVDDRAIRVAWRTKGSAVDPAEPAIEKLKSGDYRRAVQVLRLLVKARPNDVIINYNLGMALSDLGWLDEALECLRRAVEAEPTRADYQVALGVALHRQGDLPAARTVLERALAREPDNPYALRNLAGCLLALGDASEQAIQYLRKAASLMPDDQQAWMGLGQALEQQQQAEEADQAYLRAIEINPHNPLAEAAKTGRSRIAQRAMRGTSGGGVRMDAVMYCLSALEQCDQLSRAEIQKIALEIGVVGTKGINPNDPDLKYRLRSLPGEFTGLHLLCWMYVTWKWFAPQMDIAFDLSREYAMALKMRAQRRNK